jgi:hypothetical protein
VKCIFEKGPGDVLVAVDENAKKLVASVALGEGFSVEAKKARNIKFHRLFFALLNFAFEMWDPPEDRQFRGQPIQKNFERFREEVLILAGHYDPVYSLDGSLKLEAKSIAFANCDEHEFREVYGAVLNVVWDRVFRGAHFRSKDEVEEVVRQLLAYG